MDKFVLKGKTELLLTLCVNNSCTKNTLGVNHLSIKEAQPVGWTLELPPSLPQSLLLLVTEAEGRSPAKKAAGERMFHRGHFWPLGQFGIYFFNKVKILKQYDFLKKGSEHQKKEEGKGVWTSYTVKFA